MFAFTQLEQLSNKVLRGRAWAMRDQVGADLVAHRPRATTQDLVRELLELSEREHRQLLVLEHDADRREHGDCLARQLT